MVRKEIVGSEQFVPVPEIHRASRMRRPGNETVNLALLQEERHIRDFHMLVKDFDVLFSGHHIHQCILDRTNSRCAQALTVEILGCFYGVFYYDTGTLGVRACQDDHIDTLSAGDQDGYGTKATEVNLSRCKILH